MSKGKNQQEMSGPNSVLDVNPGAEGILDALEALDSKREVAA